MRFGVVIAPFADVSIDEDAFTAVHKGQTEAYFEWASYGTQDFVVDIFFHTLDVSERDEAGECRARSAFDPDYGAVDGFNEGAYDTLFWMVVMQTGCSYGCGSSNGRTDCAAWASSVTPDMGCDLANTTEICSHTALHEQLHSLGLGYHQNGVRCTEQQVRDGVDWRTCDSVEYAGILDTLGGANEPKGSWGVNAATRAYLGWLSEEDLVKVEIAEGSSHTVTLAPLEASSGPRALVVGPAEDSALASLGALWFECRKGTGYDTRIRSVFDGANYGVLGFHYGSILLDLMPNHTDSNDRYKVALKVGSTFEDTSSGTTIEVLSVGKEGCTINVDFSAPPTCEPGAVSLDEGLFGHFLTYLGGADDVALYGRPSEDWTNGGVIENWIAEYMPYYYVPEELAKYELLISYQISLRNGDTAACDESAMTVRAVPESLPDGWRIDEGACYNIVGGQAAMQSCFTVAVARGSVPHGAYEVAFKGYKENTETGELDYDHASEEYHLWICVGGFNPWFQDLDNDRYPAWKCNANGLTYEGGTEPVPWRERVGSPGGEAEEDEKNDEEKKAKAKAKKKSKKSSKKKSSKKKSKKLSKKDIKKTCKKADSKKKCKNDGVKALCKYKKKKCVPK